MSGYIFDASSARIGRIVVPSDEQEARILTAMKDGCYTGMIADRIGLTTAAARRILNRMERQGLVHRNRRSAVNCIRWQSGRPPLTPQ